MASTEQKRREARQIFLTGGSGDLGTVLASSLTKQGDMPIAFDIRPPQRGATTFRPGSILDRDRLQAAMAGADVVVHIAAWHGIHEAREQKDAFEFWDLNVTGTLNVFETAARLGIGNIIHISSTSVDEWPGLYGSSKVVAELVARSYYERHGLNVIILRPRAFIPHWNRDVYGNFIEWARWFWKGAVHINDVAQAVLRSINVLTSQTLDHLPILDIDGAYDYSDADFAQWDEKGPGSTFARVYPAYVALGQRYGLDPAAKPKKLDGRAAQDLLGYEPQYSLADLLADLSTYGSAGPPFGLDEQ